MANDIISLINSAPQELAENEVVNLGTVYRRFLITRKCPLNNLPVMSSNGTSVSLNKQGLYDVLFTAVVSAPAAGTVTLQLEVDGQPIAGAEASETITTPTTELRNLSINYVVLVDESIVLNIPTISSKTISLRNVGDEATIENIVTTVVKEV